MTYALNVTGLQKRFGPVQALGGVDFSLKAGEVHALLGVNGAGKSTFIKIISGLYQADQGDITVEGMPVEIGSPADALSHGIVSVQQHPELVDDFTGYENIFLGQESLGKGNSGFAQRLFGKVDHARMRAKAAQLLERFPINIDLDKPVSTLSGVEREVIAILHALKHDEAKILILDEPTSTLTRVEAQILFMVISLLKKKGVAIIYITHRLDEVYQIADHVTVFRGGRTVSSLTTKEAIEKNISIPHLMLEDGMGELYPPRTTVKAEYPAILKVSELSGYGFEKVSFSAAKGEIIGLFGLVGSGIDELSKALFGASPPHSGHIELNGQAVKLDTPSKALSQGIYLVPGDRRSEGLILSDDVTFNTTLANPKRASRFGGALRFFRNRHDTSELASRVDLQPPHLESKASNFSGGNQQKIVIAKGLFRQADVYLFVEPTVGVDIGARSKIYMLMRELSKTSAVVVLSSDYDEAYGISDRTGAFYRGKMVLPPLKDWTRSEILSAGISGDTTHA